MKLIRILAALGVAAWLKRRFGAKALETARSMGRSGGLHAPRVRTRQVSPPAGSRSSAASAASGAYRDDRDIAGVGALRDDEVTSR